MNTSQTQVIDLQVKEFIHAHIKELESYLGCTLTRDIQTPDTISRWLNQLSALCNSSPEIASFENYHDARQYVNEISDFLMVFKQDTDPSFEETELGKFIRRAKQWLNKVSKRHQLSFDDVWNRIAPASPDHIAVIDQDVFEAQWWSPVPMMDVEILLRTEGVKIVSPVSEPPKLAGGISVRFTFSPDLEGRDMR